MSREFRWRLHRMLAFFVPYRGYKRPKMRALPEEPRYIVAGAVPMRRAVRLP